MRVFALVLLVVSLVAAARTVPTRNAIQDTPQTAIQSPSEESAIEFSDEEVSQHRMGEHKAIRPPRNDKGHIFEAVRLSLVVGPDGKVISASAEEGPSEAWALAVAEGKTWSYKPFEKDRVAISAKINDYVAVLPPEDLPKTHQGFPNINGLNGVVMKLSRSRCFGSCPAYSVEIHGDGTTIFKGQAFVVTTGEHRDHLSVEQVSEILEAFRNADYFSLNDEYSYSVTDCPTYVTSFRVDQVSKTVTDYVGLEVGMPQSVSDLEMTIDRVADTMKWIKGNEHTVAALKAEGWNFKSPEAAKVMARAAQEGSSALVKDLLAEGVGPTGSNENGNSALAAAVLAGDQTTAKMLINAGAGKDDAHTKTEALAAAAKTGNMELVRLLLDYGANPKGSLEEQTTVLMSAAASGVQGIVETILASGADANARDKKGRTALWYLGEGNTYWDKKRHADRGRVVHLLARSRADLNAQDEEGNTALHTAYEANIAQALIHDGANVNIRNKNGETPLLSNFSEEVAKLLVAAGADIQARDNNAMNALDHAIELEPNGDRAKYLKSLGLNPTGNHRRMEPDTSSGSERDFEEPK